MPRVLARLTVLLAILGTIEALRSPVVAAINFVSSSGSEVLEVFILHSVNPQAAHEMVTQPCTATIAESVGIVRWGTVGDTFCGSGVDVAKCMRDALEVIGAEGHLVGEDKVVS